MSLLVLWKDENRDTVSPICKPRQESRQLNANTSRLRPALHGVSIGHATGGSGTLGCVLDSEADGRQYILFTCLL